MNEDAVGISGQRLSGGQIKFRAAVVIKHWHFVYRGNQYATGSLQSVDVKLKITKAVQ